MNTILEHALRLLPDKAFIDLKYYRRFRRLPNWKDPQTYNEKLQWLKLHDHDPRYVTLVDKYEMKHYVADRIGEEYVVPAYGVWDSPEEIDPDTLPDQFVLKTTHDCGGVVICRDRKTFDFEKAKEFLAEHLKYNYFYEGREWPYKQVKPRILCEAYMENADSGDLKDYKVFAFDGKARALFIASDRQDETRETKFDFFDTEFHHLDIRNGHPKAEKAPEKPRKLGLLGRALLQKNNAWWYNEFSITVINNTRGDL